MRPMRWGWLVAGIIVSAVGPRAAWAAIDGELLLEKLVARGVLTQQDAAEIRSETAETQTQRNKELANEILPDNWKWTGDIRLRNESRNRVGTGNDANRQRVRLRLGFESRPADTLRVGARVVTGTTSDIVTTNDSFDDTFAKKPIALDLAFAEYAPAVPGLDSLAFTAGIMENPFWTVGQLVWDADLSFDGAALKLSRALGPVTVFTNNGVFLLDSDESEAASLWSTQSGLVVRPFADAGSEVLKRLKLTGALAYHDYRNTTNAAKAGTDIAARESQNSAGLADLNLLNPTVELATQLAGVPASLFGDWVHNFEASHDKSQGILFGMKLGKAKTPFSLTDGWEAGYAFQQLEADAAFDEFTNSDLNDGGTNNRGHTYYLTLAVLKNSTVGVKYSNARQISGAKTNEDRLQLDWLTKF